MKNLYQINDNKKKKTLVTISILFSIVCLSCILLIFFFHPRSNTWVYYSISLIFLVGLIAFDYYFLIFKLGNIKSKEEFIKRISSNNEEVTLTFVKKDKTYYSNKLSFLSLQFVDSKNSEIKLSILEEDKELPFKENKVYKLLIYKEYIVAYEEINNEKA